MLTSTCVFRLNLMAERKKKRKKMVERFDQVQCNTLFQAANSVMYPTHFEYCIAFSINQKEILYIYALPLGT